MKRIIAIGASLLLAVMLTACGQSDNQSNGNSDSSSETDNSQQEDMSQNGNDDEKNTEDNNTGSNDSAAKSTEKAKNQDDMKATLDKLDFNEIEVEVSYGKDKEYEAEIEHHENGAVEAEVEDELDGTTIDDDLKAFNNLYPKVSKLQLGKNIDKQDAIDQVLKAFDLQSDYEKFEVEITFKDGTKLSFED
ncbi:hypothetical protein GCM10007063_15560 [Lentibacillus kapialis]|uniref:YusW-like protein n=1 Tax=Lentibacillus kapialis TaxID=340214 RepID=A0A917PVU2_9BACI|nr:YusW family protein [Lentibacillus kapialis]GGJ93922.1 hypothetical protein GCM10007063_15560 [Lentibacillus kapialis]